MLSHANNGNRCGEIAASTADQWLNENPHRKAEHMTGRMVSDTVAMSVTRKASHRYHHQRPDSLVDYSEVVRQRDQKLLEALEERLLSGKVITRDDMNKVRKDAAYVQFVLDALRGRSHDLLTIRHGRKGVGWCLVSTLFDNQQGISNAKKD